MTKKLEEIRKKIDTLDNKIHDMLMQRARLIVDISAEKKRHGSQYIQPAREAVMIRRLLKRHQGALPEEAVVLVWRELVGAASLIQTRLKVLVCMNESEILPWEMARNYFGSVVSMQKSSSPLMALAAIRENEASFAVLPWPHEGEEDPWWPVLLNQENKDIKIVCALPYGSPKGKSLSWEERALIVAKIDFVDSKDDHSFIALNIDHGISRARLMEAMKSLKFEPVSVHTHSNGDVEAPSFHLIEVVGYVAADDLRLDELAEKFDEYEVICLALGGYPVPPVFKKAKPEKSSIPPAPVEKKKSKTGS